ncbi:MAG: ferredoxin [Patescibacteria group bacterium]
MSPIGKIVVERELCIGAASCVAIAPGVFELDKDNIAIIKDAKGGDDTTIMAAAESCPTKAIFIYDIDGKQVYP